MKNEDEINNGRELIANNADSMQKIKSRLHPDEVSYQQYLGSRLFDGAHAGDSMDDVDLDVLPDLVAGEMMLEAALTARRTGVTLLDDAVWVEAANEVKAGLTQKNPLMLASVLDHVLVVCDVPRRDGGSMRIIAGYRYSLRDPTEAGPSSN